jgi:hypothetical protein
MKLTSRPLRVSCQHFCLHSYMNGWVCSEIFRDSIALIELILSVKIIIFYMADCRKPRRENTRWPLHTKSHIPVCRVNHQRNINSTERTMQYPPLIRVEQRLDTYRREHRKAQLPNVCLPLDCSKSLQGVSEIKIKQSVS